MYSLFRKILFTLEPELAHHFVKRTQRLIPKRIFGSPICHSALKTKLGGIELANPVGLAAGFDKNGEMIDLMASLGFGFLEIGSVTAKPCMGNPKPRLFRLPRDQSLVNRLGLPNWGADKIEQNLQKQKINVPLGINIAKTPGENDGIDDFIYSLRKMASMGDYFVFNLSCPNTSDGRTFEDPKIFKEFSQTILQEVKNLKIKKPILVKLSPVLEKPELQKIVEQACQDGFNGFVLSNTTPMREGLETSSNQIKRIGKGGLSGRGLLKIANQQLSSVYQIVGNQKILMGVGGIMDFKDLILKLSLGARYFQVYTGLIYRGPFFIKNLSRKLAQFCERMGVKSYQELIGEKEVVKAL